MRGIYLAGGIFGLGDSDAKTWRAHATARLTAAGERVLDPLVRDYRGCEGGNEREIVEADIGEIVSSSALLAMCVRPSWGTAMELRVARQFSVPVYAFGATEPISPWLRYHSTRMFVDIDAAIDALLGDLRASFERLTR
jgi:nucleoside 2-deoxyribosyltransferase